MQAFSVFEAGSLAGWKDFSFQSPRQPSIPKQFLKQALGLTGMEVSLNELAPGQGMPFRHHHQANEELYIFLEGQGEFEADGQILPIRPGTCLRCAPETARAWRCVGSAPLRFIVIQAPGGQYGEGSTTSDGRLSPGRPAWISE